MLQIGAAADGGQALPRLAAASITPELLCIFDQ
jgi:hypothetical protein